VPAQTVNLLKLFKLQFENQLKHLAYVTIKSPRETRRNYLNCYYTSCRNL